MSLVLKREEFGKGNFWQQRSRVVYFLCQIRIMSAIKVPIKYWACRRIEMLKCVKGVKWKVHSWLNEILERLRFGSARISAIKTISTYN